MTEPKGGLRAEVSELAAMLRAYAVQETLGPLRGLARYVGLGLLGALGVSLGVVLGAVAVLRMLQSETGLFDAHLSFVPYLAAIAFLVVALVGSIWAMSPPKPAERDEGAEPNERTPMSEPR